MRKNNATSNALRKQIALLRAEADKLEQAEARFLAEEISENSLADIVYTSGNSIDKAYNALRKLWKTLGADAKL